MFFGEIDVFKRRTSSMGPRQVPSRPERSPGGGGGGLHCFGVLYARATMSETGWLAGEDS